MVSARRITAVFLIAGWVAALSAVAPAQRGRDQELFNQAKILIFDKKWPEARELFQRIIREFPASNVVPQAYFFSARCLQLQGNYDDALPAYEEFLRRYPDEPFLPAEARNAVVEMAASLLEKGDATYKDRLSAALTHPNKDVRYFAALRCSHVKDRYLNSMVIPILKEIVNRETERDLVDRARIALLRLEPKALSERAPAPKAEERETKRESETRRSSERLFHLEVYEEGESRPKVELNLPVSLAQLAIAALDDSTRQEMRRKGIDVDNIWESLNRMGSTDILTFRDGRTTVRIWIK